MNKMVWKGREERWDGKGKTYHEESHASAAVLGVVIDVCTDSTDDTDCTASSHTDE
jgi:hypothetical protein